MKILIFSDWFEPAYKAGGPVRSVVNLVHHLSVSDEVYVITADRDFNDKKAFDDIQVDQWMMKNECHIYYYSPGKMTFSFVKRMIRSIDPDWIYLNSMFSNMFIPLWVAFKSGKIIIAPRGMLKPSAFAHKSLKKYLYCSMLQLLGIDQYVRFHAADLVEAEEIKRVFPKAGSIIIAPNLPGKLYMDDMPLEKEPGKLSMLFSARLHPIKNLDFLLQVLHGIDAQIELTIAIIKEDENYFNNCMQLASHLPSNIKLTWLLDLPPVDIHHLLQAVHLFVLPTKGESFGHSIFEALSLGCPVLVSDQTPWKQLDAFHAGFALPLDKQQFADAILTFAGMSAADWELYRLGAVKLAKDYINRSDPHFHYNNLFSSNEG